VTNCFKGAADEATRLTKEGAEEGVRFDSRHKVKYVDVDVVSEDKKANNDETME
jgi:hypothetical protein